jgi:tetrahydromethanopterin S-methyltransferase subunit B
MQNRVEAEQFWIFAREVVLKVLQNLEVNIKKLQSLEDFDGAQSIERELIPKYEKLFNEFSLDLNAKINYENIDSLKKIISDIVEQFKLDKTYLQSEAEKRKELKNNSGAEVVKKFFEYQLVELNKKREILLDMLMSLVNKEEDLSSRLSEAVQEEAEQRYLEELTSISKQINLLNEKLDILKGKIDSLNNSLDTRWRYEIFGTVPREDMLKAYNENKEER